MTLTTQTTPSLAFRVQAKFQDVFGGRDQLTVRSPGRVNLIGEHTYYNHGFVLPAAINKAVYMVVSRRSDDELHLVSFDLDRSYTSNVKRLEPSGYHWPDYILGVVQQLQALGKPVGGFNCVFGGDIPLGRSEEHTSELQSLAYLV